MIWNYERAYSWIVRHEVILPINCVKKKKKEEFVKSTVEKWLSKSKESISEWKSLNQLISSLLVFNLYQSTGSQKKFSLFLIDEGGLGS